MIRSRMASAIVGSPTMSYRLGDGYCEVMIVDFLSCLSSIISSRIGRSLAGAGKRMCQNEPNPESQIKDFRGFSSFRELGNAANGIFYSSQYWESRFLLIFDFPPWRKASFCQFSFIIPLRKPPFPVLRSSYPYESFFFPFFINCNLYLSDFSWKIDDLCPYLSSFSYWAVSDCWFSKRHLCFDTASPAVCIACICVLFHYSLELVSKSEVRVRMCNFQAFRAFLHNVALVCCKILRETGRQEEHLSSH